MSSQIYRISTGWTVALLVLKMPLEPHEWPFQLRKRAFGAFTPWCVGTFKVRSLRDFSVRNPRKCPLSRFCPIHSRSAPKGRQQMGETGFCKNLRFPAVSCENLQFPAVFCANLRLPNPLIYRASRKSAKICKNLRKCASRVRFLPFAVSLLARPDIECKNRVLITNINYPKHLGGCNPRVCKFQDAGVS